jgi:hypothetical protein
VASAIANGNRLNFNFSSLPRSATGRGAFPRAEMLSSMG